MFVLISKIKKCFDSATAPNLSLVVHG